MPLIELAKMTFPTNKKGIWEVSKLNNYQMAVIKCGGQEFFYTFSRRSFYFLEDRKSYDKWVEKAFENNYFGKYELVKKEDLKQSKYNDIQKYRYYFTFEKGTEYTIKTTSQDVGFKNPNTKSYTSNYKRYYIFDRLNEKKYSSGAEFSYFSTAMEVYARNLEAKRNKN